MEFTAPLFTDAYVSDFELNAFMNQVITFKVLGHESEPVSNFIDIDTD